MNDSLKYMEKDPLYRSFRDSHNLLTARYSYFRNDNFILPLSHDEVILGQAFTGKGQAWLHRKPLSLSLSLSFPLLPSRLSMEKGACFGKCREIDGRNLRIGSY